MQIKPLDRLLFEQGGTCFFCSVRLSREEATVEHLVARANGGKNAAQNCVACCREINNILGSLSLKEKLRIVLNQKGKLVCPKRAASAGATPPVTAARQTPVALDIQSKQTAPILHSKINPVSSDSKSCPSLPPGADKNERPAAATATLNSKPCSPKKKAANGHSPPYYTIVLKDLKKRGESRPKRVESLRKTIHSVVKTPKGSLQECQLDSLIEHLKVTGKIKISGTTVTYKL